MSHPNRLRSLTLVMIIALVGIESSLLADSETITLLDGYVHLGDGTWATYESYGGAEAYGSSWETGFNISLTTILSATLYFDYFETNVEAPVYVNGNLVSYVPTYPFTVAPIPGSLSISAASLNTGANTIRIESAWVGEWDDFAIGNIQLAVIPEPATLSLLVIGGLALLKRRRR